MNKNKFVLEQDEADAIKKWIEEQKKKDSSNFVTGERWSYIFTPTGLGMLVSVRDNLLEEEKIVTNLDNWT